MKKKFDIIVYGATGFTGSLCVKYLKENYSDLVWGIAGRNQKKLEDLSKNLGINCKIFIADGNDLSALNEITKQTKVVLTTAGPFHRYGSKLVASCVENSTHYVDITGENFWVKNFQKKFGVFLLFHSSILALSFQVYKVVQLELSLPGES